MGAKSNIEWTDASWTPIRARNLQTGKVGWHCEHATTGCEFCYAEGLNKRLGTGLPFKPGHRKDIEIFLDEDMLTRPLRWKKPRMIFVCSMTDLFADFVKDEWIDQIFAAMALSSRHTFQVLTKRPERMLDYVGGWFERMSRSQAVFNHPAGARLIPQLFDWSCLPAILPNAWLGVSCERQQEADERIPLLLQTPAAIRFVSAEPLLGPIDLTAIQYERDHWLDVIESRQWPERFALGRGLDWVIAGGESGPKARPMHPQWARDLRDQCNAAGVPFFFKQWGGRSPKAAGRALDETEWSQFPEPTK
jgi:protein gp37